MRNVLIFNWAESYTPLLEILTSEQGPGLGRDVSIVCFGRAHPDAVLNALRGVREAIAPTPIRYVQAAADLPDFEGTLRNEATFNPDDVSLVLADNAVEDPDTLSRLTCMSLQRVTEAGKRPTIFAQVVNLQAEPEIRSLGVEDVFHGDLVRSLMLAQSCISAPSQVILEAILRGEGNVRLVPTPPSMQQQPYRQVALRMHRSGREPPMTLLGIARDGVVQLNPEGRLRLRGGDTLMIMCSQLLDSEELDEWWTANVS